MLRKNTFKVSSLKKYKDFNKLTHGSKIIWLQEHDQINNDIIIDIKNIEEFISCLHNNFVPDYISQIKNESVSVDSLYDYIILGVCEINSYLHLFLDNDKCIFMYLITDSEFKELFISINVTYPIFWYKFGSKKDFCDNFDKLFEIFNPKEFKLKYDNNIRAFIGNDKMFSMDMNELENNFLLIAHTE
jgi:hypothetical protein